MAKKQAADSTKKAVEAQDVALAKQVYFVQLPGTHRKIVIYVKILPRKTD